MAERQPDRTLGPYHDTFWEFCNQGEFRLQRCASCGRHEWPPKPLCPGCLGEDHAWVRVSGTGTILTFCTLEQLYFSECPPPWRTIMVELDEGPLFISNPLGIPPDEIKRGTRVRVAFIDAEDAFGAFKLPVFQKV